MSNLENLFDSFLSMADNSSGTVGQFWEEPVDLLTFFTHKDYLRETPYPGKQTELLEAVNAILWNKLTEGSLCPEDLKEVQEMVVMFGKGSGKDFLASGILAYVCYLLCCMNDPQDYFDFGQDEPIDLINVAINAYQANNVFFKKLKARLNNCKWFVRSGMEPKAFNEYQLTKNQIRFARGITAHSAHSEADSFEGFNPLMIIFDEFGGFDPDKAEDAYATLRSSAVSRYNEKLLLIFISFPRHQEDMMMTKYREATEKHDPLVWASIGASWEVNPRIKRSSLDKDYERDPEGSKLKYECIPPAYAEGLFQFPEMIDRAVATGRASQIPNLLVQNKISTRLLANNTERHFIGLELHNLQLDPSFTYYLGGDGGVTTDSYVLVLGHAEPTLATVVEEGQTVQKWVNKPVEDLILEWVPSKKDRLPVDLLNVADIIETICRQVHVKKALFDKFNSAEVVQRLMSYGVEAEDKNFSNPFQFQIYQNLKALIYTGQIELLDHTRDDDRRQNANEELKSLKLINGNKIDHDKDKSKDVSDARASFVWLCSTDEPETASNFSIPMIAGAQKGTGMRYKTRR
ncbi:hypothetical protein [Paenibacillus xylanexedens]|uniref:hypothetical protein n=1 Tax=Paenibacillus xylanexedens TaxID=528191 RepID=UPI00119F0F04|nr:hypothetical protein [Paenibacillus xylanexedens]